MAKQKYDETNSHVVPGVGIVDSATGEPIITEATLPESIGMSDEAIAAANKQLDEELAYAKAFRYNPSPVAASVMYKTIEATGLSKQDIVTIALVCFQSASQENVQAAIAAIMGEKAQALFNSLK